MSRPPPEKSLLTKIDRWFRLQINVIVDFQEKLAWAKNDTLLYSFRLSFPRIARCKVFS